MTAEQRLDRLEQRMEDLAEAQLQASNRVNQVSGRIDEFVFQAQRLFNRLGDKSESNEARIEQLDRQAQLDREQAQQDRQTMHQVIDVIREMQTEVRGLQVENQRIMRHLFGEEET